MTQRTSFQARPPRAEPDFTTLTNTAAIARLRQLAALGLREDTLQALSGWHRSDVRRAITPAPAVTRSEFR
jgi:hypothetical protein